MRARGRGRGSFPRRDFVGALRAEKPDVETVPDGAPRPVASRDTHRIHIVVEISRRDGCADRDARTSRDAQKRDDHLVVHVGI